MPPVKLPKNEAWYVQRDSSNGGDIDGLSLELAHAREEVADMAAIDQVEAAWEEMGEVIDTSDVTPVTYINSAASLKAFCGKHGGIVCTSSNAAAVLRWRVMRCAASSLLRANSTCCPRHAAGEDADERDALRACIRRTDAFCQSGDSFSHLAKSVAPARTQAQAPGGRRRPRRPDIRR